MLLIGGVALSAAGVVIVQERYLPPRLSADASASLRSGFEHADARAGRFTAQGGVLAYNIVLTRHRASGKPIAGVMQIVVAGASARGPDTTVSPKPVAVSIGGHEIVRGSLPLPEGFRPRETTIQVLDCPAGKALGMRVMLVK